MSTTTQREPQRLRGDVFVTWSQPRSWRVNPLAPQPFWVEIEAVVRVDGLPVDHLSWSHPLTEAEQREYEAALIVKATVLHGRW